MAAVKRHVIMRNFPVVAMKLNEGAITRSDVIGPNGGVIEGVVSYASQLDKGDFIIMDASITSKGDLVAVPATVSAVGLCHGVLVSEPRGIDTVTASLGTPALAYQRVADVALFGLGIIEVKLAAGETAVPGDGIGPDSAVAGEFAVKEGAAAATLASNGSMMALGYGVAGEYIPVLVNAHFAVAE